VAVDVLALADRDPALAEPVVPGRQVTRAELVWAVRHEGALDASDLLDRRTRLGLVPADRPAAESALPEFAPVGRMAESLRAKDLRPAEKSI
jgi:glycerol-3-phosphate dehydrogenase